jgi:diguanylate cyclase (GGDEF)-like protein
MIKKDHVEALIELTSRYSKPALLSCLTESLQKIASATEVTVYELYNQNNDSEFNAANIESAIARDAKNPSWLGSPLSGYEGFSQSVITRKPVQLEDNDSSSTRLIFPIQGRQGISGLLVIDCNNPDDDTLYIIRSLSKVWNSQQTLIDRNERDVLTGLANRQALENKMQELLSELVNAQQRVSEPSRIKFLSMLDIDHFKDVNDRYGHLFGDELLVHFARLMTKSFRYYDYLFRYGGEEFIVILNDIDVDSALSVLDRFRKVVEDFNFPGIGNSTISIGMLEISTEDLPTTILDKADKALYYAKQNGRNMVCDYNQLVKEGKLTQPEIVPGEIELF